MTTTVPHPPPSESPAGAGASGEHREARRYRYPGSPPFRDDDVHRLLFTGRTAEAETILHSILAADVFLLYAVSGLGKTSLLNAGVLHELRARGHWPVVVRLNDPDRSPVDEIREQIAATAAADATVELDRTPGSPPGCDPPGNLWDLVTSLEVWRDNELQHLVLVFDQFEELFTLGWDSARRDRFIAELGEVVRRHRGTGLRASDQDLPPDIKVVIVIREDALGELAALTDDIPQIMRNQFRLCPLDPDQAERAIRLPAAVVDDRLASPSFTYTDAAVGEILDFLRTQTFRGTTIESDAIDPSQLQIICHYIERRIVLDKALRQQTGSELVVDVDDLGGADGLGHILTDFYARTVAGFPNRQQDAIRELCEKGLINRNHRRLSLEEDEILARFRVSRTTLEQLVDERLLRAEPRVGSVYYELAHDTLVGPILDERETRLRARRSRRLRWLLAVGAVLVLLVAAVTAYTVGSREPANEVAVERTLEPGSTVDDALPSGAAAKTYAVEADAERPLMLTVAPVDGGGMAGLAVVAEVTRVESGLTRRQEQPTPGVPLRVLIPPAPDGDPMVQVRVSRYEATAGDFRIGVGLDVTVTDLVLDTAETGDITAPGDVAVFRLPAGQAPRSVTIEVVPTDTAAAGAAGSPTDRAGAKPSLDAMFEVVDSSGRSRQVDARSGMNGNNATEQSTVASSGDDLYVVVRGKSTTGGFRITARPADDVVIVPDGQGASGEVGADRSTVQFQIQTDGDTVVSVTPERSFDPVLEIVDADGGSRQVDAGGDGEAEAAVLDVAGTYQLVVSGWSSSTGTFEITAGSVETLSGGGTVSGTGTIAFSVDVADGEWFTFVPRGEDPSSAPTTLVVDPTGEQTPYWSVATFGGVAGRFHLVAVTEGDQQIEGSLTRIDPVELGLGGSDTTGPSAVYRVRLDAGEHVALVTTSDVSTSVDIRVVQPSGAISYEYGTAYFGGDEGTYDVVVTAVDGGASEFTATLDTISTTTLSPGATATGTGTTLFEVVVGDDRWFELDLDAGGRSASEMLDVRITDPLGDVTPAGPSSVLGGASGTYDVLVTSYEPGTTIEFVAALQPLTPVLLEPGASLSTSGPAVFGVRSSDDEWFEVELGADLDTWLDVRIVDPDGFSVPAGVPTAAFGGREGTYHVVVAVPDGAAEDVEVRLHRLEPVPLEPGSSATGSGTTIFSVDSSEPLGFAVTVPSPDAAATLMVQRPDGTVESLSGDLGEGITGTVAGGTLIVVIVTDVTGGGDDTFQIAVAAP